MTSLTRYVRSVGSRWTVGDEAVAGKLRRDLSEYPDLRQNRVDTALQHWAQRLAAVFVHPQEMLCRELDRSQRVFDLVCHLPRHFGPGLETM